MRRYIPLLADFIGLLLLLFGLETAVSHLQARSGLNVLLLSLLYFIFCMSVYAIRKLEAAPGHDGGQRISGWFRPLPQRLLAILFGAGMALLVAEQLGYLDGIFLVNPRVLGAGESLAFFSFAPGAWLGLALFYLLILGSSVRETVAWENGRYNIVAFLALFVINGMLVVTAAELRLLFGNGNLLTALLLLLLLLLLFLPPRLWYWRKRPSAYPLVTFLPLLASATYLITA